MKPYPKFDKAIDLRCKLTHDDIRRLKIARRRGTPVIEIAKDFDVSIDTVYYWTAKNRRKRKSRSSPSNSEAVLRTQERKRTLMPSAWREYERDRKQYHNDRKGVSGEPKV